MAFTCSGYETKYLKFTIVILYREYAVIKYTKMFQISGMNDLYNNNPTPFYCKRCKFSDWNIKVVIKHIRGCKI